MIDGDEHPHVPELAANWQENYAFYGWDAERSCGLYLHLQHHASEGTIDVRVGSGIDGTLTGTTEHEPGDDCLSARGLEIEVLAPFAAWRIRYRGTGHRGPDLLGWSARPGGDVPFGFDVELRSVHPPVSFASVPGVELDPMMIGTHYELGGTWAGSIWSGERRVEGAGLFVRDHTWGAREFRFDLAMWTPMILDGGRRFIGSLCVLQDDEWRGCSVEATADGVERIAADHWVRVHGPLTPGGYRRATCLRVGDDFIERYDFDGHLHAQVLRHRSFRGTSGLADMFSTVRGEGRTGFGTFQWGPVHQPPPTPIPRRAAPETVDPGEEP